jgi:hypothetical protein
MSREPFIYRQYAYLRITGSGPAEEITNTLGVQPDEIWSEGDPWEHNPAYKKRYYTSWKLNSGLDEVANLNDHIGALLTRISHKREALLSLATKYTVKVVCVSYTLQNFSFELDFEHQKMLTDFGLRLWFDAYSFEDTHELVAELRQQLENK